VRVRVRVWSSRLAEALALGESKAKKWCLGAAVKLERGLGFDRLPLLPRSLLLLLPPSPRIARRDQISGTQQTRSFASVLEPSCPCSYHPSHPFHPSRSHQRKEGLNLLLMKMMALGSLSAV